MECQSFRERIAAYLDGSLLPEEKMHLEKHLDSCSSCRTAFQDLKKSESLLKNLDEVEPPPWMTRKIMARVESEREKKGILHWLFYPLHVKLPIEALAMVFLAVVSIYLFRSAEPEMKSLPLPSPAVPMLGAKPEKIYPEARAQGERETGRPEGAPPAAAAPAGGTKVQAKVQAPVTEPAQQPPAQKKKEPAASSRERDEFRASPPEEKASASPMAAPPAALKEQQGFSVADSAPPKRVGAPLQARKELARTIWPIDLSLSVKDKSIALGQVETILDREGARNIRKETREEKELLTAEIKGSNLTRLLESLNSVGEVKEKRIPPDLPPGDVPIRLEISGPSRP